MYNHWFVSRQKRKLTDILPALIAFNDLCVGQKWTDKKVQQQFEDELQNRSITEHGKLRARKTGGGMGGTRTLFKQMKDLGLVFTEDENGLCRLTLVAESMLKAEISFVEGMRIQLKRYQYPSATTWKGSGGIRHEFNVHPFQFLFRLLKHPLLDGYLSRDEIALIVIHLAKSDDEKCLNAVAEAIINFRNTGRALPYIEEELKNNDDRDKMREQQVKLVRDKYNNIANTLCNYMEITQFIEREPKIIRIRVGKEHDVDTFIEKDSKFISHPELQENYIRAYGRGYSSKDLRTFNDVVKNNKEILEARIQREYILLALKMPIMKITASIVKTISEKTGIDERTVEKYLTKHCQKGNIDDFFASYKELAHMGREGASEFEKATCEIFKNIFNMRAEHTGPKGNTPDVFIESADGKYCGIIDNKAYKNDYSITGDHKRVMQYEYIPNYKNYVDANYPLKFFSYIAGSFGKNIDKQLDEIISETEIFGSAVPVDIFIKFAQDYAEKQYNHDTVKKIFTKNREVRLFDLERLDTYEKQSFWDEARFVAEKKEPYSSRDVKK